MFQSGLGVASPGPVPLLAPVFRTGQGGVILHADMDAFYAAVEQRDHPKLRGRPVVVGGLSDRGVVSAASYEAREFGVHSAMPTVQARKLCPHAVFLCGDMARYRRESRRVFQVFQSFTPAVEGISLDEAFLDLDGTERLWGTPRQAASRLRARVRRELRLAVSVGIAPVKLVAKIASALAKPDGLLEVTADGLESFLAPLPVGRLWGVGPVARARLRRLGISTIGELAQTPEAPLRRALGRFGVSISRLARGQDLREVEPYREARSYSEENTFVRDVTDRSQLVRTLRVHAEALAARLRRDGVQARTLTLKLKGARPLGGGRFPLQTRSRTFARATDDGRQIAEAGKRLLDRAHLDAPVRLLGLALSRIEARGEESPELLPDPDRERRRRLNRAIDSIQARFGTRSVETGAGQVDRAGLTSQIKRGVPGESPRTGSIG